MPYDVNSDKFLLAVFIIMLQKEKKDNMVRYFGPMKISPKNK